MPFALPRMALLFTGSIRSCVQRLNSQVTKRPLLSSVLIGSSSKFTVDTMVQLGEIRSFEGQAFSWTRTATFTSFGALYLGACQWSIYGRVFPWICRPLQSHLAKSATMVALDQLVVFPAVYFPLFYSLQAWLDPELCIADGIERWRSSLWSDCTAAWTVWTPVQMANFTIVPIQWRAPLISITGVFWTVFLSHSKGSVSEIQEATSNESSTLHHLPQTPQELPIQLVSKAMCAPEVTTEDAFSSNTCEESK